MCSYTVQSSSNIESKCGISVCQLSEHRVCNFVEKWNIYNVLCKVEIDNIVLTYKTVRLLATFVLRFLVLCSRTGSNDSRLHVVEPPRRRSFIWQIGVNSSIQDQRQVCSSFFGVESVMRVNADSLLIRASTTTTPGNLNDLTTDLIMANNNNNHHIFLNTSIQTFRRINYATSPLIYRYMRY